MSVSLHPVTDLGSLLDLEMVKPDAFLGVSPAIGWDRIYGGQVVAQALRAAGLTVAPEFRAHSVHAYFVRPGDEKAPVLFEVDRVRDGRSFCTRQVIAAQAGGAILNLIASFQVEEDGADVQRVEMPAGVPGPDAIEPMETTLFMDHRVISTVRDPQPHQLSWMRVPEPLGEDPLIHACALAYLSDEDLLGVALLPHPSGGDWDAMMAASVDHADLVPSPGPCRRVVALLPRGPRRGQRAGSRHRPGVRPRRHPRRDRRPGGPGARPPPLITVLATAPARRGGLASREPGRSAI